MISKMTIGKLAILMAACAFIPIIPYLFVGYGSHDCSFHYGSWMVVRDAWRNGHLWPGIDPYDNFTLGDPHYYFYPPVSMIAGGALSMIFPLRIVPGVFIWLMYFASGWSMYLASKDLVAEEDRSKAALFYLLCPYVLFTGIVRFAASELIFVAFLPLVLLSFYRAVGKRELRSLLLLGGLLGLGWITSIPGSVVAFYVLILVSGVTAIRHRESGPVVRFAAGEAIAVCLAAFYLVPSWIDRKWISPSGIFIFDVKEFMLFSPPSKMHLKLFGVGVAAVALAGILIIGACFFTRRKQSGDDEAAQTWWYIALVSLVFQLPVSLFLWYRLPELGAVQFPYRFLSVLWAGLPLALFAKGTLRSLRWPACIASALLGIWAVSIVIRVQVPWKVYEPVSVLVARWMEQGKRGAPEYVPPGLSRPLTPAGIPPAVPVGDARAGNCTVAPIMTGPSLSAIKTDSETSCQIRLLKYYYPYWRAIDEAGRSLPLARDKDGLLLVTVPAGSHAVNLEATARSPLRSAMLCLSVVSLFLLEIGVALLRKRPVAALAAVT